MPDSAPGYPYHHTALSHSHKYLLPKVLEQLRSIGAREVFELGCGNGSVAKWLMAEGYDVTGVDPSEDGVRLAAMPNLQVGSTDEDLAKRFGTFPVVLSLEVVEHVFSPMLYATRVRDLLKPGGVAIISTPYHSYLKNLALAITGKMDAHFTALWEGGHIKFWSRDTLKKLFAEQSMTEIGFERVGRIPPLAMSMICVFKRS